MTRENARKIVCDWLNIRASYADNRQLDAYMNLVSSRIELTGIPGVEQLDYSAWKKQTAYDFEHQLIQQTCYAGIQIVDFDDLKIRFRTRETIETGEAHHHQQNHLEIIIALETGDRWRATSERLLAYQQTVFD